LNEVIANYTYAKTFFLLHFYKQSKIEKDKQFKFFADFVRSTSALKYH